jgi:hypothetical protein
MTYFLRSGNKFNVSATAALDIYETLPVGTYTVKFNEMAGAFYLEGIDNFEIKGKVYGDTQKMANRVLDTFKDRNGSTGVMLSGEKGSGKTLLAKMLSLDGMMEGIPTIVINQAWCGDIFNSFMQTIEQPTIVIFDEFEKVYDREEQEKMLTLLDGVYTSKKLFVITCNDKYRVNEHMRNRPGRIFYRLEYKGLEQDFIIEYCEDNLKNKTHIDTICRVAVMFGEFNFDMLKAMVEEMNRYDESPQQVMKVLNAKPELGDAATYDFTLHVGKKKIEAGELDRDKWRGNPLSNDINISYLPALKRGQDEDDRDWVYAQFGVGDLKSIDSKSGEFKYVKANGDTLSLSRVPIREFDMDTMMM